MNLYMLFLLTLLGATHGLASQNEGPFIEGQALHLRRDTLWNAWESDAEILSGDKAYEILGFAEGAERQRLRAMDANTMLVLPWSYGAWRLDMDQYANDPNAGPGVRLSVRPFRPDIP
ncbi:MAG: hypothetical protein C0514_00125 [Candidatus Puniceispirillum sp.]|nr:hypothetical protein [Candidatus Puniceispirillum sp.]